MGRKPKIEPEEKYLQRMQQLYGQKGPDNNQSELALNRNEIIDKITQALKDAKK